MNLSSIIRLGSLFVSVESKVKSAETGLTAVESTRGSVGGHPGQFVAGFVPDSDVAAVALLAQLESEGLSL